MIKRRFESVSRVFRQGPEDPRTVRRRLQLIAVALTGDPAITGLGVRKDYRILRRDET